MAQNPSISQLDPPQIMKRIYDEGNDAVRVEVGSGTGFAITMDASTDSITSISPSIQEKVSLTSANSGTVIPATSAVGITSFNLYTNTTSTLVGPQACTLQISPSDTDNVWTSTTVTVTPSTTSGTVVMGTTQTGILARRFRVIIAAPITSGTFDLYLVGQGA